MALLDELFGPGAGQPMPAEPFNVEGLLRAIRERLAGEQGVMSSVPPGPRPAMAPIETTEVRPRPQPGVPYAAAPPVTTGSLEPTASRAPAPQAAPAGPARITRPPDDRGVGDRLKDAFSALQGQDTQRQRETENLTVRALVGKRIGEHTIDEPLAWAIARNPTAMKMVLPSVFGAGKAGLQPIFGTDPEGNVVIGQLTPEGRMVTTKLPPGFKPGEGQDKVDLGTSWLMKGKRTGAEAGIVPKDIRGKEREEELGKQEGQRPVLFKKADASLKGLELQHKTVLQDIDRALAEVQRGVVPRAGVGALFSAIPGTPQHNLANLLNTIKSNIGFDKLQAMREASPTGGALGQVSDFENRLLQSVLGAIEQSQSSEQLKFNLDRLKTSIAEQQQNRRNAFQRDFGDLIGKPTGGNTSPAGAPARIGSDAEYEALPSGTTFIGPDGKERRKP